MKRAELSISHEALCEILMRLKLLPAGSTIANICDEPTDVRTLIIFDSEKLHKDYENRTEGAPLHRHYADSSTSVFTSHNIFEDDTFKSEELRIALDEAAEHTLPLLAASHVHYDKRRLMGLWRDCARARLQLTR